MLTHTSYDINMARPNLMGQGGGLSVVVEVVVQFYLGEPLDKEALDAAFTAAKQELIDIDTKWHSHDFEGIMEFYRGKCAINKPAIPSESESEG
jgi:hypothetical protein